MTENELLHKILDDVTCHGACDKVSDIRDWRSLANLMFSPQGIEFLSEHYCIGMRMFREIKFTRNPSIYGVHIDSGDINLVNERKIALIGSTRAKAYFCGADDTKTIILAYGASIDIDASDYAILKIYTIGDGCKVRIKKDKTVIIL